MATICIELRYYKGSRGDLKHEGVHAWIISECGTTLEDLQLWILISVGTWTQSSSGAEWFPHTHCGSLQGS